MINWRSGKAGFIGAAKTLIKGVFSFQYSVTSEAPIAPTDVAAGVSAIILGDGAGVAGSILELGAGTVGEIIGDGAGVSAIIIENGAGVFGEILESGAGVLGEIG